MTSKALFRGVGVVMCGGAVVLAGCAGGKDKDDARTDSAVTTTTAASADGTMRADSAKPAATEPSQFSDANILAREITGDSGEVAIATMARDKATRADVKSYASLLVSDHGKGLAEVRSLAKKVKITPETPQGDTTTQAIAHAMQRLQGLAKGPAFDTAFVNHEVEDHQEDIKDAHAMSGAAKNAEVKSLVDKSIPELQKHLDRAQKLAGEGKKQ